ncbi:MAG: hypothetical protein HY020_12875 [Burkholderiales bacterium]|nr:hypothetical protein [Burkholderiales bacterium]
MHSAGPDPGAAYLGSLDLLGNVPALERQACASTVRHVFELIWPQAGIECHASEAGLCVDVCQGDLRHAVQVPWALVEFDRGLVLVRAVYRAGLPGMLQRAAAGLSLSL